MGEPAIPILLTALRDKHTEIRAHATVALGEIGGERAVAALIQLMGDMDRMVQRQAVKALRSAERSEEARALMVADPRLARHPKLQ